MDKQQTTAADKYLIVGQGLAGTLLGLELRNAGVCFRIAEGDLANSASPVAAGILNPITGKRLVKSWRLETFFPTARKTYSELEDMFGLSFFEPTRILRLFQNEKEKQIWKKRKQDPEYIDWLGAQHPPGHFGDTLRDDLGSFEILHSGTLDVKALLNAARKMFLDDGCMVQTLFSHADLQVSPRASTWQGEEFQKIIFCEGFRIMDNPWFKRIPMEPARGEVQKVQVQASLPKAILNRGKWLRPEGEGIYQAGATHSWDKLLSGPEEKERREMVAGIRSILQNDPLILERKIGVRSSCKDRRPILGTHPENPSLAILNGLGSKGTLMGPWLARHLAKVIIQGVKPDPELNVQRFWV